MSKFSKLIINCLAVMVILLPLQLKAADNGKVETIQDLQKQFISYGGSADAFNKIVAAVKQARNNDQTLKDKIANTYNQQLAQAISANNFDPNQYAKILKQIDQEKSAVLNQNLVTMQSLLQALSLNDRKAYAKLLYGVTAVTSAPTPTINSTSNNNPAQKKNNPMQQPSANEPARTSPQADTNANATSERTNDTDTTDDEISALEHNEGNNPSAVPPQNVPQANNEESGVSNETNNSNANDNQNSSQNTENLNQ